MNGVEPPSESGHRRDWRFAPPRLEPGVIRRPRLLSALHQRWSTPAVTVTAGAGFGKSTLLSQAIAENELDPSGTDVYVRLLERDASALAVARTIAQALGVTISPDSADSEQLAPQLHDALWAHAPHQIALVLDDVHLVLQDEGARELLAALVGDLPRNAHLVLSSRSQPLGPGDLWGRDAVELTEDDLVFGRDELQELGIDADVTAGWPAAVGMSLSGHADDVGDLLERTLLDMDDVVREALAATALLGGADAALLSEVDVDPSSVDRLVAVPLVSITPTGWLTVHEIWSRAIATVVPPDRRAAVLHRGAEALRARGLHEEAFTAAIHGEDWRVALAIARDLGASYVTDVVDPEQMERWLARLPSSLRTEPGALLLEAVSWRLRDPWNPRGAEAARAAAAGFRERGDSTAEVSGLHQAAYLHFVQGDQLGLADVVARVAELDAAGVRAAAPYAALGRAVVCDATGDDHGVLDELAGIDTTTMSPDWVGVVEWLRTNALLMLGRHSEARRHGEAAGAPVTRGFDGFVGARAIARWFDGAAELVLREHLPEVRRPRDRFFLGTNGAMGRAAVGRTEEARQLLAMARIEKSEVTSPAESAAVALTQASIALGELDEAEAVRVLARFLDEFGFDRGPIERALRNRLAMVYLASPETRSVWDDMPLGPGWQVGLSLARAILRVRESGPHVLEGFAWPTPALTLAHLSLLHSCELAAAGKAAGCPEATHLIRWLNDTIGPNVREVLRHLERSATAPVRGGARALLGVVPARPSHRLEVCVLGPMAIRRGGEVEDVSELHRERVRALLALLVAHGREHRGRVAALLWPDFPERRAAANLRTTLNYLLRVLEPRRASGEPSFHLRAEGGYLELVANDLLDVDLWAFDRHVAAARRAEREGLTTEVLEHLLAACALWRGDPFVEFTYEEWAAGIGSRARRDFVWAATRSAELLVAGGRTEQAVDLATRAVAIEPLHEASRRTLAYAYLERGERAAAWRVMESCLEDLDRAGLVPESATLDLVERVRLGLR